MNFFAKLFFMNENDQKDERKEHEHVSSIQHTYSTFKKNPRMHLMKSLDNSHTSICVISLLFHFLIGSVHLLWH